MFHEVVRQHLEGVVGFLITTLLKFTKESSRKKFCKSVKIGQNYGLEFVASIFGPPQAVASLPALGPWAPPSRKGPLARKYLPGFPYS